MSVNALKFMNRRLRFLSLQKRLEYFPPFWLMGIKVLELHPQWKTLRIRLPLTWRSKNMGGSMFGGWQASLADPIAPLSCARVFRGHDVWTRKLTLDFQKPGTGDLELRFHMSEKQEAKIREELEERGRATPEFEYGFYLPDGERCTVVHCTVAIRPENYLKNKS